MTIPARHNIEIIFIGALMTNPFPCFPGGAGDDPSETSDGASRHSLLVGGDSRDSLDVADVLTLKSSEINTNAYAGEHKVY